MPGLVPPARPKPLRRGEGPGTHVLRAPWQGVDGRDKPGHDAARCQCPEPTSPYRLAASLRRRLIFAALFSSSSDGC